MTTQQTAQRLVQLCRQGEHDRAYAELFHDNAVGIEPEGINGPSRVEGLDKLKAKNRDFGEMLEEMHNLKVSDPLVADRFFTCTMAMDATFKDSGRSQSSEICLYETDENGKIIREQFFYSPALMGNTGV